MTNSGLTVINKTDLLPRLSCVSSQRITSLALALSFFCMSRLSTTEKNKHRQNSCCSSAATWLCIFLNMKELLEKKNQTVQSCDKNMKSTPSSGNEALLLVQWCYTQQITCMQAGDAGLHEHKFSQHMATHRLEVVMATHKPKEVLSYLGLFQNI